MESLPPAPALQLKEKNLSQTQLQQDKIIVHGMLTSSLFSAIFGTLIPGSIYRSQKLSFRSPVYCYDSIVGRIDVKRVRNLRRLGGVLVTCDTRVLRISPHDSCDGEGQDRGVRGGIDLEGDAGQDSQENMEECVIGEAEVWLPDIIGKEG